MGGREDKDDGRVSNGEVLEAVTIIRRVIHTIISVNLWLSLDDSQIILVNNLIK